VRSLELGEGRILDLFHNGASLQLCGVRGCLCLSRNSFCVGAADDGMMMMMDVNCNSTGKGSLPPAKCGVDEI